MRSLCGLALVVTLLASAACGNVHDAPIAGEPTATTSSAYGTGVAGVAVALTGWRWQDVMSNLPAIRDAGYTAVLLSPHTATCSGAFGGQGYDPSDFRSFDGGFGSEYDLGWLVRTAHYYGLQVYANMVMNHMCTHGDYSYAHFSWNDFHHDGQIANWSDTWSLENQDLFGLNDLAQESTYVRGELWNYLVKTNDLGFDGYRFDAVKHVPLWYWRDHVVSNTNAWGKYNFGEVYDANLDTLGTYASAGMAVTDYNLYFAMKNAFGFGGDLGSLDGAGFAARNGAMALTFVENHDVGAPTNRLLAYAFIAAYPGYPLFANADIHDAALSNLAWIHKNHAYGAYINRWREHDVLAFERQGNLLAAFNQSGDWRSVWVSTSWSSTKLHDYSGHTSDVWTAGDARVQVSIPPGSYVMLAP